jgi:hypothetical protein
MVMDFYIIISLATVFGLLAWWLYLAISGLRDESSTRQPEAVARHKHVGLENPLNSIFSSCLYDNPTEQSQRIEPRR